MIHVFKSGGNYGTPPNDYSIECINEDESAGYLADGWSPSLDEALSAGLNQADTDGDGKMSIDEARAYLESVGVTYEEGLHWKKVVALAEQHSKGE